MIWNRRMEKYKLIFLIKFHIQSKKMKFDPTEENKIDLK